jgi:hypothetical protein
MLPPRRVALWEILLRQASPLPVLQIRLIRIPPLGGGVFVAKHVEKQTAQPLNPRGVGGIFVAKHVEKQTAQPLNPRGVEDPEEVPDVRAVPAPPYLCVHLEALGCEKVWHACRGVDDDAAQHEEVGAFRLVKGVATEGYHPPIVLNRDLPLHVLNRDLLDVPLDLEDGVDLLVDQLIDSGVRHFHLELVG